MKREDKKFVIQRHSTGSDVHWDFMLESGDVLQTYRLDKSPQQLIDNPAGAVKIFDHPLKFLTYEGPVNNGRGEVSIADSGTYKITRQSSDQIELILTGKALSGKFILTHIEADNWRFAKSNI
jgi:hypothetical protein